MRRLASFTLPFSRSSRLLHPSLDRAYREYLGKLQILPRGPVWPIVVFMIGLPGSKRVIVADEIAKAAGYTFIVANTIRDILLSAKESESHLDELLWRAIEHVLASGGNVVVDMDAIATSRRARAWAVAKKNGAHVEFVRTHCSFFQMMLNLQQAATDKNVHPAWRAEVLAHGMEDTDERRAAAAQARVVQTAHLHYRTSKPDGVLDEVRPLPFELLMDVLRVTQRALEMPRKESHKHWPSSKRHSNMSLFLF